MTDEKVQQISEFINFIIELGKTNSLPEEYQDFKENCNPLLQMLSDTESIHGFFNAWGVLTVNIGPQVALYTIWLTGFAMGMEWDRWRKDQEELRKLVG